MTALALIVSLIATFFLPLLAIPLNFLGMIFTKGKVRKTYGLLLAVSLAVMAYIWVPDSAMDLYRHHQDMHYLSDFDFGQLSIYIQSSLEPIHYLIKFFIAQTGNFGLLQFFVILCGYFELFWIVSDLAEIKKLKRSVFTLLLVYAFASVRFIDFASGLWCNFAIINLALAIYLEFFKKTKWIQYVFYVLAACLHTGTIYVVVLAIILSRIRFFKKVRLSTILIIFLVIMSFGGIVFLANNIFGSEFALVSIMNNMYNWYFVGWEQAGDLHTGWNLYLSLASIILSFILAVWCYRKKYLSNEYSSFVAYFAICIIATMINAGIFIRYGFLLAILVTPLIAEYLTKMVDNKKRLFLASVIVLMILLQFSRFCAQMESVGLTRQIDENITNSMVDIMTD